jgi:hypothetical protein
LIATNGSQRFNIAKADHGCRFHMVEVNFHHEVSAALDEARITMFA